MLSWIWPFKKLNVCLFTALPCSVAATKDKDQACVCLTCQAWLCANLPGFETLRMKRELECLQNIHDGFHKALGVSQMSSKSIVGHVMRWRRALEEIAATEPEDGPARRVLKLAPGQKTIEERGDII